MSIKNIIKVANYYNIKYSFDKLGQLKKIDPDYQKLINRILEVYKLGDQIEEDGWWGDKTSNALAAIQRRFELNPFTDSKGSLDQLYQVLRKSDYTPLKGVFKTSSDFVKVIQIFKQFLILHTAVQSKWDTPDLIIDFFEGMKNYLNRIISFANNLQKIPSPEVKEATNAILNASTQVNERLEKRLALANQLKLAQENNQDTSNIIAALKRLQEEAQANFVLDIFENNANQIQNEISQNYSSSGQYMPKEII